MNRLAVQVESLSKRYRIGMAEERPETLLQAGLSWIKSPLSSFRRLRSLSQFSDHGDAADVIWALRDVSFTVSEGEVVGIIGRNGAGKSTLLKILSRITPPSSGRVILDGRVASLLEVGTGFHPELTGRENVYLNGTVMGMRKAEIDRKFDEIVAFSGVEQFIDTPIKRFSSGMKVRLAFSVAAHLEPEILLIDEVLAVGDVEFQKKCLGKMSDIASAGRTVLFVSHNMGAISALCQRTIFLSAGQVNCSGSTEEVIGAYLGQAQVSKHSDDELQEFRWPGMGEEVCFTEIGLENGEAGYLHFGDSIDIHIVANSSKPIGGLSVGISLFSAIGECIATVFTKETVDFQAGESQKMSLHIPNFNLAPGHYYVTLSLGTGGQTGKRRDLDVVSGTPAFQIVQTARAHGTHLMNWHRKWGNIVLADARLLLE